MTAPERDRWGRPKIVHPDTGAHYLTMTVDEWIKQMNRGTC